MSQADIDKFKQIITSQGYRLTKARELTFGLLINQEPQSISELITKAGGTLDRVSVYRNIELFEKLGIVNRIYVGWKYRLELSEEFVAHHHHMSCLDCNRTIDIEDEQEIDDFIHAVAEKKGFTPRRHTFEIDGYCNSCAIEK